MPASWVPMEENGPTQHPVGPGNRLAKTMKEISMTVSRSLRRWPNRLRFFGFPLLLCLLPFNDAYAADPTPAELIEGFARLDQDGNGFLSRQEFALMKDRIRAELKPHFLGLLRFDRMGESGMSRLFDKVDLNHDGKLSLEEFKLIKPSLVELLKNRV